MIEASGYALRVQLTTACQLTCGYCRPQRGTAAPGELTADMLVRLVRVLVDAGVRRVRLTGGEPLLADAVGAVRAMAAIAGIREVALTTNGQRLAPVAERLRDAGLTRVNVHIDTLDAARYERLCGGNLERALRGLTSALACGLRPKLNVVVQRGWNDDEIPRFCEVARDLCVPVRFIELMDTGVAPQVAAARFVPAREIAAVLEGLGATRSTARGSAPATEYELEDGTQVGIIASESKPFCARCNRLRLSASGVLRTCLYADSGLDLGRMIEAGGRDAEILAATRDHLARKAACHPAIVPSAKRFSMAAVGG